MANPLTLYVPIKQDRTTQDAAQAAHDHFAKNYKEVLNRFGKVHYARFLLIPNPAGSGILAICVITTFDGPMNPYLTDFWNDDMLRQAFSGFAAMALAKLTVANFTEFENFINSHNLSHTGEIYQAYEHTVLQIKTKLSPSA
jgi:hypothetical protein